MSLRIVSRGACVAAVISLLVGCGGGSTTASTGTGAGSNSSVGSSSGTGGNSDGNAPAPITGVATPQSVSVVTATNAN